MEEAKVANSKSGIGDILKKAWEMFIQNWKFFAIVWLIGLAISAVLIILILIFAGLAGVSLAGFSNPYAGAFTMSALGTLSVISLVVLCVLGVISILLGSWIYGAYVYAIFSVAQGKKIDAWGCFQLAWKKIWTFFGLGILTALIVGIGFLLLIIPGIIFAIMLFFSFYLVAAEDLGAFSAIGRSFKLAAKKWLDILVYTIIVGAAVSILSFIPIVNIIATIAGTFFILIITGVLYKQLK